MPRTLVIAPIVLLAGCVAAPIDTLRPANTYAGLSCAELAAERQAILDLQSNHARASSSQGIKTALGILSVVAGRPDQAVQGQQFMVEAEKDAKEQSASAEELQKRANLVKEFMDVRDCKLM